MEERKCFDCEGFEHITYNCRNVEEKRLISMFLNIFEVLKDRVMQREEDSERKEKIEKTEVSRSMKNKSRKRKKEWS